MATGHLNPGYGDVVSRLRREKSANPSLHHGHRLREMENESVDRHSLEEIRRRAREVWSQSDRNPTTYGNHFSDKTREIEPAEARPASPSRRNNPHPPLVFMSCRLHTVPGFYNPNATVGREAYKVDGSVGAEEHRQRAALKSKFINRPSTAAILQYSKPQELDVIKDPRERQATEAWLKLANDADREAVGGAIMEAYYTDEQNKAASDFSVHPPLQPSLHRFNKFAGPAERENFNDLVETYNLNRQRRPKTTIGTMRFHDIENTKRVAYVHKPKRGDFLLHPQWPPSIPHHRLNGLSSVEMPYLPGSR